ncbi:MAG: bifunctional diaminohydroxyphosphoribosylaminopyrimidine deaminase/5-amino-6-(5-phosphoribosylamino)uracil reductase RibD, partial [Myxococcota bacterium]|nr:bifunctional diaminohydroxyphosphoribosylaminopyrimidine deaminase/5-amino-6-(5-phosphoribosylamino)uracil reductase RibD [Myxococcota bacterium]
MSDSLWMQRAIDLASQGRGRTAPNPMVGAVVVREGRCLGSGWHRAAGQPHAEADALSRIDGEARGATMYVNLEPCCHHGRTPPCTDGIIAAGIERLVVGMVDPDERVRGGGIQKLQEAGIRVEVGLMRDQCQHLNAAYLKAQEH